MSDKEVVDNCENFHRSASCKQIEKAKWDSLRLHCLPERGSACQEARADGESVGLDSLLEWYELRTYSKSP